MSLLTSDAEIASLLARVKRIALVGASSNPARASYEVMRFLLKRGYDVVPVNPALAGQVLLGQTVVASIADAGAVDMVDVFRNADAVPAIVDEALAASAPALWLQLGVVHEEAAARAAAASMDVVMDRCPKQEIARLKL
jgi:hypothetical protein